MFFIRRLVTIILSFIIFISPASQLFQFEKMENISNKSPMSFYEKLTIGNKQEVSPNPDVYPGFYNKGGQTDNSELLPLTAGSEFGGEKCSVGAREAVITPVPATEANVGAASVSGSKTEKLLVVPVQFTDEKFDSEHNQSYFQGIMGELKNYYELNSDYVANVKGMTIDCTLAPVVTSAHSMAYYGDDGLYIGDDEKNTQIYEMAREAVKLLNPTFDFSSFDCDNDGVIDHLIIIHAGDGQEDTCGTDNIWSHRWCIGSYGAYSNNNDPYDDYLDGEQVDGKYAYNYVCVPETGTLGVFAHEFGHDLGLPDLYDTDGIYDGYSFGAGDWDVMGTGSWNSMPGDAPGTSPANLSAWCKEFLGWISPVSITADGSYTLNNMSVNNQAFKMWTDGVTDGDEYFLAEYRRKNGYDAGLPGEGLLVWHIDMQRIIDTYYTNKINSYANKLGVSLEQADGINDLYNCVNTGDSGDPFPGATGNENFTSILSGMSNSNINTSVYSNVEIDNIKVIDDTVTADYYVRKNKVVNQPAINIPAEGAIVSSQPTFSWDIVPQASSYILQISETIGFTYGVKEVRLSTNSLGLVYKGSSITYTLPVDSRLQEAKTYYWRVTGDNEQTFNTDFAWSGVRTFKTTYQWQKKADMLTARGNLAAVEYNDKIYTFGGYVPIMNTTDTVEVYDLQADAWAQKSKMLTSRQVRNAVVLNGKIYLIGGWTYSDTYYSLLEEYDPEADKWAAKASLPDSGPWSTAAAANGKIYYFNYDYNLLTVDIQEYDTVLDKWTHVSTHTVNQRGNVISAAVNNKIYLIMDGQPIIEYDPLTDTFVEKSAIVAQNVDNYRALAYEGKIYFPCEQFGSYYWMYEYDISQDTIEPIAMMPIDMDNMAVAAAGGKIYVMGGTGSGTFEISTVQEFTIVLQKPVNINSNQTENQINLSWDEVTGASGYYILADGIEYYCETNSFTQSTLLVNSRHTYQVKAIIGQACSGWSDILEASTTGAPVITIDTANLSEGHEDGALITVHLANGEFKAGGIYNKATVLLDPAELPYGVRQGEVVRKDASTLEIRLIGNSLSDYNGRRYATLIISKDEITTGGNADITAEVLFDDVQQTALAINIEASLDDTFEEGCENGKHIIVNIENGQFILDPDQAKFQLQGLPAGVGIGAVSRLDDNSVDITLSGNSTVDYDIWLLAYIVIDASQIQTAQSNYIFCHVILPANIEAQPEAPQYLSFSFSGTNAGKLMDITTDMEYSLDGGHSFAQAAAANQLLSKSQINSITAANNIIIRMRANDRYPYGLPCFIDIYEGYPVSYVTGNDSSNTVSGMDNTMEYSTDCVNWTKYNGILPDLSGNITLYVRRTANGQNMAGQYISLVFTSGSIPSQPQNPGVYIPTVPSVSEPSVPEEIENSDFVLNTDDIKKLVDQDSTVNAEVVIKDASQYISIALEAQAFKWLTDNKKDLVVKCDGASLHIPYDAISEINLLKNLDNTWVKMSIEKLNIAGLDTALAKAMQDADKNVFVLGSYTYNLSCKIVTKTATQAVNSFKRDVSVSITLNQTDLQGRDTDKLGVYYFNETSRQWEYMGGTYDSATEVMTFTTGHLSIYSVALYLKTFKDIEKHWAKNDIEKMVARHVINGVSADNFNPEGTITRAQFVAMLVRAVGIEPGEIIDMPFTDVNKDKWFYPEIGMAAKSGIISKDDGVMFRPDANITREEMAVLIGRVIVMKLENVTLSDEQVSEKLKLFKDAGKISEAAREMVAIAVNKNIIYGRPGPVFAPGATTKRAEAAVIMKRILSLIQ